MGFKRQKTSHTNHAVLARLKRQVNALRPEMKCYTKTVVVSGLSGTTGSITYISDIAQGTDISNRIGDRIRVHSIDINVLMVGCGNSISGSNHQNFATGIYLVRDLESNGVVPDLSGTAQAIFTAAGPLQDLVQPNTRDRFKVVKKWVIGGAEYYSGNMVPQRRWHAKVDAVTTYHDATSGQTGAGKFAYYLVMTTEDTMNTVNIDAYLQLNFTDA